MATLSILNSRISRGGSPTIFEIVSRRTIFHSWHCRLSVSWNNSNGVAFTPVYALLEYLSIEFGGNLLVLTAALLFEFFC
jgi:hypothetical protein